MTPYDLSFRKDKADAKLCTKTLTKSEVMQFRKVNHRLAASLDTSLAGPDCCLYMSTPAGLHCYDRHACNVNIVPRPGCNAQAVSDDFYFQMYYDNLPIWGFIGKPGPLIL